MQYVNLGTTGLRVSRICLGMMSFGNDSDRPWVIDEEAAEPIVRAAVEGGITFFDTADTYSGGASEVATGRLLSKFLTREEVVVATKVFMPMTPGENGGGLSRKHILSAIDASLQRLGMDYVDLYQIHRWDPRTPIEETMEALHDVVRAGKARYIGASSMFAWQFAKAQHLAERDGWTRFVSMQNHYNLVYREEEREMIPLCIDQGVGVIPWSPLARGVLAGNRTRVGRAAHHACRQRSVHRLPLRPAHRLRRRRTRRRGRRRARRRARAGRAGLAAAQARRHCADRRSNQARAPAGRARCRAARRSATRRSRAWRSPTCRTPYSATAEPPHRRPRRRRGARGGHGFRRRRRRRRIAMAIHHRREQTKCPHSRPISYSDGYTASTRANKAHPPPRSSRGALQHDDRNLTCRFLRVVGELRHQLGLLVEQPLALLAAGDADVDVEGVAADLDGGRAIGEEVVYQAGFVGAPALEAKITRRSPSGRYIKGVVRAAPLLAPTLVSSSSGAPSNGPPTRPPFARNSSMTPLLKSAMSDTSLLLLVGWL